MIAFVSDWPATRFCAIEFNLPFMLGCPQISAFLDRLDECYYVPSTLDAQWGTIKSVPHELKFNIDHKHLVHFKAMKADCREVADIRLPVSRELLVECALQQWKYSLHTLHALQGLYSFVHGPFQCAFLSIALCQCGKN